MMLKKIWIVNLLLMLALIFLGIKTYAVWVNDRQEVVEVGEGGSSSGQPAAPLPKASQKEVPSEAEYELVAVKNLFAADRVEPKEEEPEETKEPGARIDPRMQRSAGDVLKEISLYGVVIVDDYRAALLQHPAALEEAGLDPRQLRMLRYKRTRRGAQQLERGWVKVGEGVDMFTLSEILADRVVLTDASEGRYEVFLYDTGNPKEREEVKATESKPIVVEVKPDEPAQAASPPAPPAPPQPAPRTSPGTEAAPGAGEAPAQGASPPPPSAPAPPAPPRAVESPPDAPVRKPPANIREKFLRVD